MHETSEPKKMLILYIMDILWKYSDAEHTLTYNDIIRILDEKYNMVAERKAVRRNLFNKNPLCRLTQRIFLCDSSADVSIFIQYSRLMSGQAFFF